MRSPLWMRKLFVAFVAVITLGTVIPTGYLAEDKAESSENYQEESYLRLEPRDELPDPTDNEAKDELDWPSLAKYAPTSELLTGFVSYASLQSEEIGLAKFGETISNRVGSEYKDTIVPRMTEAIASSVELLDEETIRSLRLTDKPASGYGERIMHVYNEETGEDLLRFHVRRDHPPQDGYWFNFHYHDASDNFEEHYEVGKIYWDKNTPPKWLS
ncbi:YpjP family protein [Bacillus sp. NTK071]|uniref:YpjP family protein n=1 Tax=Bacillus sp. NTK071 TaxID=2802175 RepID=UPI001A903F47|nr:YpjP family protein [Bacillus sp. NTK071]MBN8207631.1 YpjP family protein [Bacillus sp. NTK071]